MSPLQADAVHRRLMRVRKYVLQRIHSHKAEPKSKTLLTRKQAQASVVRSLELVLTAIAREMP